MKIDKEDNFSLEELNERKQELKELFKKLPYYQQQGLRQANDLDGWPMYTTRANQLGLTKFLYKEIGVAAFDSLYGMYYLYLRKDNDL
jgi:hypothetical protein